MALTLRKARLEEADAVCRLVRSAYAIYVPRMDREPAPMHADYERLTAAGFVTIAEESGKLRGVLVGYFRDDHFHVENIAVAPGGQGRGVGATLMEEAERIARRHGVAEIELYTNEAMTENLGFYHHLGFEISRRGIEAGYARIYLRKRLS